MRWYSYLLSVALVSLLPAVGLADSTDDEATAGTTGETTEKVDFDIGENVLGDPDKSGKVSSGTIESLTFLSGGADPVTITVKVVNWALSFLGLLSLIFIAYAGVVWFTAGGDEEKVKNAKDIIKGALIGLIIVLSSMGLAQLFFNNTVSQTTVQTNWPNQLIQPAYAEGEEPTYKSEELPFDSSAASASENTALTDIYVGSSYLGVDLGKADPVTVVIAMVNGLLTLLGLIFLILLVYAGVLWATARGNEEQITKAKTIIKRAVIGLVIVLAAYGISFLTLTFIRVKTVL